MDDQELVAVEDECDEFEQVPGFVGAELRDEVGAQPFRGLTGTPALSNSRRIVAASTWKWSPTAWSDRPVA